MSRLVGVAPREHALAMGEHNQAINQIRSSLDELYFLPASRAMTSTILSGGSSGNTTANAVYRRQYREKHGLTERLLHLQALLSERLLDETRERWIGHACRLDEPAFLELLQL